MGKRSRRSDDARVLGDGQSQGKKSILANKAAVDPALALLFAGSVSIDILLTPVYIWI